MRSCSKGKKSGLASPPKRPGRFEGVQDCVFLSLSLSLSAPPSLHLSLSVSISLSLSLSLFLSLSLGFSLPHPGPQSSNRRRRRRRPKSSASSSLPHTHALALSSVDLWKQHLKCLHVYLTQCIYLSVLESRLPHKTVNFWRVDFLTKLSIRSSKQSVDDFLGEFLF